MIGQLKHVIAGNGTRHIEHAAIGASVFGGVFTFIQIRFGGFGRSGEIGRLHHLNIMQAKCIADRKTHIGSPDVGNKNSHKNQKPFFCGQHAQLIGTQSA